MAELALCSVFPPVQVGMTVLAIAAHVGKHRIDVAILARHADVQATQRISGLAVIKLGLGANRHPGRGCVALFAGNFHRAMRASARRGWSGLLSRRYAKSDLEQQERVYEKQITQTRSPSYPQPRFNLSPLDTI